MYLELSLPCQYKYIHVYTHYESIYIKENLRFGYVLRSHLRNISVPDYILMWLQDIIDLYKCEIMVNS